MKRLLSIIASAALIFTSAPAMTSFAEDKTNDLKLHFKIENGEACLTGEWSDNVTELVIPETYEGKPVTSIDEKAFTGNENIVSCVIPDTVKSVGDLAFAACPNLKSISIGSGFSSLGNLSASGLSLKDLISPRSLSRVLSLLLKILSFRAVFL